MPEGHSVHRIARAFRANFLDVPLTASSPQGRFALGAARISGQRMLDVFAVGKQMFAEFESGDWLRVHLGIYGAWDFAGDITVDATPSIGAPRLARVRMSEQSKVSTAGSVFPPEPVGAVRLRLLAPTVVADLRGPTACEVVTRPEVDLIIGKLGPDPQHDSSDTARDRFTSSLRKRRSPVGSLLMDQSVVAGIGNVYRAELLFRARLDPFRPGTEVTPDQGEALWGDWVKLLKVGIETGQMMTMDDLSPHQWAAAMRSRDERHWVYRRAGLPCRICGTTIALDLMQARKLYWCPACQT